MKSFRGISLRTRFFLLVSLIVLFALSTTLTFLNTIGAFSSFRLIEQEFEERFERIHDIDHILKDLYIDSLQFDQKTERLKQEVEILQLGVDHMKQEQRFVNDSSITESLDNLDEQVSTFLNFLNSAQYLSPSDTLTGSFYQLHDRYVDPLLKSRQLLREEVFNLSFKLQQRYGISLLVVIILGLITIGLIYTLMTLSDIQNLKKLRAMMRQLAMGNNLSEVDLGVSSELEEVAESLEILSKNRDEKIKYLKNLGEGKKLDDFKPQGSDTLGLEIKVLAEKLQAIQQDEARRLADERKRSWMSEGIAEFGEILRSETENVQALTIRIIEKLVTHLSIEMGTIFLVQQGEEQAQQQEPFLEVSAAYAYDRRKHFQKTFLLGEGLPGACAIEKEKMYLDEIPEDYSEIISGVGQAKPKTLLLVPLKVEEDVLGVLELASFRHLETHELEFVDELARSISSTILSVRSNEQTAQLLQQSREQADQLMKQEEVMKANMSKLEEAQKESKIKETEITGILTAMNQSSLVAELTLNGKFTVINDKFLEVLESSSDQVVGKQHHEFAAVDRYSEEYKKFWSALREGSTITREEIYRLFSGKEIWLRQTFSPIRNNEGAIYKILVIALDVTQAKIQQENLEKQAAEITRQNLEMESLNQAVNSSIIKCEMDRDGIIQDINESFETISGYNRREMLGRNYRLFLKDMEVEQFEKIWSEVLKDKTYEGAIRRTKPTGEEVWLMSTFSPVKDESGSIYKIYFLALDITEKRLKYQLLEEANKEIERLKGMV